MNEYEETERISISEMRDISRIIANLNFRSRESRDIFGDDDRPLNGIKTDDEFFWLRKYIEKSCLFGLKELKKKEARSTR